MSPLYGRAVDNKLLCTLSAIGMRQASANQNTLAACTQILNCLILYPNEGITYKASNMVLAAHSDASYLSETKSCSRAGAHIFLSNNDFIPQSNGPVLSIAAFMRSVYALAGKADFQHSSSAHMKWPYYKMPLKKWGGNNHAHQFSWTIQQQQATSTTPS